MALSLWKDIYRQVKQMRTEFQRIQLDWDPSQSNDIYYWLDSTQGVSTTGSVVDSWNDKINNISFSNTDSGRPTIGNEQINNLNVISFDGSQWLSAQDLSYNITNGNSATLAIAFRADNIESPTDAFFGLWNSPDPLIAFDLDFNIIADPTQIRFNGASTGGNTNFETNDPIIDASNFCIVSLVYTAGAPVQIFFNGHDVTPGGLGNLNDFVASLDTMIFTNRITNRQPVGVAGDYIWINNSTDREKVEGYLAHKWDLTSFLPVTHPYKNSAP